MSSRVREGILATMAIFSFGFVAVQEPTPEKKPTAPLKVAPREYFAAHCQRCHGVDGTNFVPGFAQESLDKLRADIVRMAEGPGNAPLKAEDVEVQLAYHRLMSDEKPFVSWTARDGLTLKGEVTDGAKLVANVGELKVDEDARWSLVLPSEDDFKRLRLTAKIGKRETAFAPSETAFARPVEKDRAPSSSRR